MYGIDKVIEEIKSRCADFDVDGAMKHAKSIKDKKPPMPPEGEGMMVVEVSAEPEEPKFGVPEEPKLPDEVNSEAKNYETPFEETTEEKETSEESEEKPEEKSEEKPEETMEDVTPAEQDRMDEILKAIKTFFPNENTEDVLVRIVSKLIDR